MSKFPFGLCDTHCDTLLCMRGEKTDFNNDRHHISFDRTADFTYYTQVMAVYSTASLSDEECWRQFLDTTDYAQTLLSSHPEIMQCRTKEDLAFVRARGLRSFILAVEGGKLLGGDLSRLDECYARGVRFLTLVWGGETCMGGAHDVGGGLSPFGISVLKRMLELGIVPDVSHASKEIFYQTAAYCDDAGVPFMATHSNSAAVWEHTRNLTDEQFRMIMHSGGLVGVSFCTPHLGGENVTVSTVVDHIEHYLSLGGEHTVCFGGDLDGIGDMPVPMTGVGDMGLYYEEMAKRGFSERLIADIFSGNAMAFFERVL
ncbi:MAG: membrane dipeptidase [Clostridia bacterium]|nr:membrane dipeptidase [Clostridia bacterium]